MNKQAGLQCSRALITVELGFHHSGTLISSLLPSILPFPVQGLRNMYSQVNAISVTAGFKEAHATGYNGSPKCSLTPRHVALRQNSGSGADPSTV